MTSSPIHPIQALVDGMNAAWQRERAASAQLTLGELIALLEALPLETPVVGLGALASYRGYYCDLAFDPTGIARPVSEVLRDCRAAMGQTFEGYKGGDFLMGASTPLWVASYGSCGPRLMGLTTGNPVHPITEEEES